MIISFKYNYIFIRPKKVASSTIELVLEKSLGEDDVVVKRRLEGLPARLMNGHAPELNGKPVRLRQHMTAEEIAVSVPKAVWDGMFKFTVARHPYERIISLAYYRVAKRDKVVSRGRDVATDGNEQIQRLVDKGAGSKGALYFTVDGKMAVDAIIRQENLQEDFKKIGDRLGFPVPDELPRRKSRARADRRPAREILTQEQKDAIYEACRAEFEMLGYQR